MRKNTKQHIVMQGYIAISENEEKPLRSKSRLKLRSKSKGFKLTKLKDYDGNDRNEQFFMERLFKGESAMKVEDFIEGSPMMKNSQGTIEQTGNNQKAETVEVTSSELKYNFYTTVDAIVANMNRKENREKIFEKNSLDKIIFVCIMAIISFVLISFKPLIEYDGLGLLAMAIIFAGSGFTVIYLALTTANKNMRPYMLFGVIFGGVPWIFMVLPALLLAPMYSFTYAVGIICITCMLFFVVHMPKRTAYGNEMLGKVKGFQKFIMTAEKEKLEELAMHNPTYLLQHITLYVCIRLIKSMEQKV